MSDSTYHQFKLRMPTALFRALEGEADRSNRSVSAELIQRLEASLDPYNKALLSAGAKARSHVEGVAEQLGRDIDLELLTRLSQHGGDSFAAIQMELAVTLDTTFEEIRAFLDRVEQIAGPEYRRMVVNITPRWEWGPTKSGAQVAAAPAKPTVKRTAKAKK